MESSGVSQNLLVISSLLGECCEGTAKIRSCISRLLATVLAFLTAQPIDRAWAAPVSSSS